MVANTDPIYSKVGDIQWNTAVTAANTAMDGTGTVVTVFTADATNGGFVQKLTLRAAGSCIASVVRVFLNNGSTNATAANNALIVDLSLPATTASNTSSLAPIDIPLNIALPAGYKINIALGTAVSAGWVPCAFGGKY